LLLDFLETKLNLFWKTSSLPKDIQLCF